MRLIAPILIALTCAAQAASDQRPLSSTEQEIRTMLAGLGVHCPRPVSFAASGEDQRGHIHRIECRSSDQQKSWTIRLISLGNGAMRAEPW